MAKLVETRRGLTFRQRRAMGLTFRNIRTVTKRLLETGDLEGLSQTEIAAEVMLVITEENAKAFTDPSIDWDSILSFIERLLPLILKLIEMFS